MAISVAVQVVAQPAISTQDLSLAIAAARMRSDAALRLRNPSDKSRRFIFRRAEPKHGSTGELVGLELANARVAEVSRRSSCVIVTVMAHLVRNYESNFPVPER